MPRQPVSKKPQVRYRLTVPEDDRCVHEWMRNQDDPSQSLRMLIKSDLIKNGPTDVMSRDVIPRKGTRAYASFERSESMEREAGHTADTYESVPSAAVNGAAKRSGGKKGRQPVTNRPDDVRRDEDAAATGSAKYDTTAAAFAEQDPVPGSFGKTGAADHFSDDGSADNEAAVLALFGGGGNKSGRSSAVLAGMLEEDETNGQ